MAIRAKLLVITLLVAVLAISSISLVGASGEEVLILVTQRPGEADPFYNFMLAFNLSEVGAKVRVVFTSYGTYAGQRDVLARYEIKKPELLKDLTGIEARTLKDFALALQEKFGIDVCLCMACPVRFGFSESLKDTKWVDPLFKPVNPKEVADMIIKADKVIRL